MPNTNLTTIQRQPATVSLLKNGAPDITATVQAFTSAPSIASAVQMANNREFEIRPVAAGTCNLTFAGPSGSQDVVGVTVTQAPDTWALTVTLGAPF